MPASPGRHDTTPYGRACSQCVKAKAKCTLRGDGKACERCLRLKKDCQPAVGARRKPGRKPAASKTDELEARLNGLMSMLENVPGLHQQQKQPSQQQRKNGPRSDSTPDSSSSAVVPRTSVFLSGRTITYSPHEICIGGAQQPMDGDGDHRDDASAHRPQDVPNRSDRRDDDTSQGLIAGFAGLDAEEALERFRTRKLKYFPFVHIPPMTSAARLQQSRPLLWLSIMACSARSADLQTRLCLRLREQIATQAVVKHQRSVDLLLGVVGFLGWGMYYLKRDPFMLMYCHMATAIVQDLGLDRDPPTPRPPPNTAAASEQHPLSTIRIHGFAIKLLESPVRTNEERRAVLGAYLVTVIVTLFHRKPITLPWTEHMDECLRVLDTEPETPLDRLLVYQCRLQRVALDIPGPQAYISIASAAQMRQTRDFQVTSLLARQREAEKMCPPDLPADLLEICRVSNLANEASIYSIALFATSQSAEERLRHGPDTRRAELLNTCLRLHKQWFDLVFNKRPDPNLQQQQKRHEYEHQEPWRPAAETRRTATTAIEVGPPSMPAIDKPPVDDGSVPSHPRSAFHELPDDSFFHMFSFHMVAQMSYFLVVVYRLATFGKDDPSCGWDKHWARAQLDVPGMVGAVADRFAEVAAYFADHAAIGPSATAPTMPPAPPGEAAFPDFFTRSARALNMLKATWVAGWAKEEQQQQQQQAPTPASAQDLERLRQQQQEQQAHQFRDDESRHHRPDVSFSFSLLHTSPDDALPFEALLGDEQNLDFDGGMGMWMADMFTSEWGLQ
ncbi:hypothetical protein SPBR_06657 [Sporothrix brasiliensis 5110]|uniref:Zn(2)-C6 fungal-type domain-containing protein n=1 Tax=Sporothrix brasiliensis 5110 TaxID=1398154 RepID=A0A0C2ER17_9PEZI|nr:uncharacterized protein SPBR_06657 [Sporothrix brasiliensis 5110]KIH88794.1 hypothetical protein SPBR_06657 [Sporothrix brasiliensis 5110]